MSNGKSLQTQNGKLGGIKNAHAYKYTKDWEDSPWNQIDEHLFQTVDNNFNRIVEELTLEHHTGKESVLDEWQPLRTSKWLKDNLTPSLVSLCMRSPRTRCLASSLGRELFGFEQGSITDMNVSLANVMAGFKAHSKALPGKGKIGILRAIDSEFIYGDGLYHNLNASGDVGFNPKMFVPLTPKIAVIYFKPSRYITEPMFSEIRVNKKFVNNLNDLIQVYSKKFIFYRSTSPKLHYAFKLEEFMEISKETNVAIELMNSLPGVRSQISIF